MKFMVSGTIELADGKRPFEKEIEAKSEGHAKDLAFALFGSSNGLTRKKVRIEKVSKV